MRSLLIICALCITHICCGQGFSLHQLVKFVQTKLPEVSDSMRVRNWIMEGTETEKETGAVHTTWNENYSKEKYFPAESFQYQQTKQGTAVSYSTTVKKYYQDILDAVTAKCKLTETDRGLSRYRSLNGKWRITIIVSPAEGPMRETYFIGVAIDG